MDSEKIAEYRRRADPADPTSLYELGLALDEDGRSAEAHEWYRRSAELDNTAAMNNLGALLLADGSDTEAERWFARAADAGYPLAMTNLAAVVAARGEEAAAETLLRRAAEAGEVTASVKLGGILVGRDEFEQARPWCQQAADAGDFRGMFYLGLAHNGTGDFAEAGLWFLRAGDAGSALALLCLMGLIDENPTPELVRECRDGADRGSVAATFGHAHFVTLTGDTATAQTLLQPLVDSGNHVAMVLMAAVCFEAERNSDAEAWLRRAAQSPEEAVRQAALSMGATAG